MLSIAWPRAQFDHLNIALGVRRGDKVGFEGSSQAVALPVEDLHDSVRVSIAGHR